MKTKEEHKLNILMKRTAVSLAKDQNLPHQISHIFIEYSDLKLEIKLDELQEVYQEATNDGFPELTI